MNKVNKKFGFIPYEIGRRRKRPLFRTGFTLIELVVYLAIFSIVTVFLFQFILSIFQNQSVSSANEAVIKNAIYAVNTIDSEIRHAHRIYDTTSNFSANPSYISLATDKDLPAGEEEVYVDIFVNSENRLCIKSELRGVRCITGTNVQVTSLDFNKVTDSSGEDSGVQTIITVEFKTNKATQKVPIQLQSFARLRP